MSWADHPVLAKLSALGIQAHMGVLFGLVAGIALGYRMWWQRRPTRTGRGRPLGRPPVRGGWAHLPKPLLLAGVPAVIALAWAIPLLGVTLIAFPAIDGTVAITRGLRSAETPGRT